MQVKFDQMVSAKVTKTKTAKKSKVPDYLVYEMMDGKPIYYRGYREVLNKTKTLEDIMGSSSLQAVIIEYVLGICYANLDRKIYRLLTNEIGSHLSKKNNLSSDIAIYEKAVLTADKVNKHYADVPAKLIIEVDTDADFENIDPNTYIHKKTQKLLDFGVEKVIWIFTTSQKVMVAERTSDKWYIQNWNHDFELLDDHSFNIAAYLDAEGIEIEKEL